MSRPAIEDMKERALRIAENALQKRARREAEGKTRHGTAGIVMPLEDLFALFDYIEELEQTFPNNP